MRGKRRYAAIDVGTNSTRLLIGEVSGGKVFPVFFDLRTTRLGEGLAEGCFLRPGAVARTLDALSEFKLKLRAHGVGRVRAVATSAAREAANAGEFLEQARSRCGLVVEVISGEEEAFLSYKGALSALPGLSSGVVVDIGGGSTEFTFLAGGRLVCRSIPVGAVRLTEKPLLLSELLAFFKDVLEEVKRLPEKNLVGVGGTITSLAAIDQQLAVYDPQRVQGYRLSREAVTRILFLLAAKDREERRKTPGLQPERADIIVAGTTVLWAILGYLEAPEIIVSEADLLHGIILGLAEGEAGRKEDG